MAENGDILLMSDNMRLIANRVLHPGERGYTVEKGNKPRRNTLNENYPSGGTAGYTGYFKLVLESQPVSDKPGANVDYYVNIVDGSTYDAEQNPVSGKSVCKVNNVTYQLDPYRSGMIAETSIFALKYTAPVAADPDAGTEAEAAKVEIVNLAEEGRSYLPSDTSENCWYQLGRAIVSANEDGTLNVTIQQDHQGAATNGIPQIWWYGLCEG